MSNADLQPAELVTVSDEFLGSMLLGALHEANIEARSVGDFTTAFTWESKKVQIVVRESDLERARDVLAEVQSQLDEEQSAGMAADDLERETLSHLTHFDESGASRMVDVGEKASTHRVARASAVVEMQPETLRLILDRQHAKGDVLEVARLAGIMAAKRTGELIPLCHPLSLESVQLNFHSPSENQLQIEATVELTAKTGVEMEALTAVSVAALTVYDMCKSVDRGMRIVATQLEEKRGGKSGAFVRE